MPKRSKTLSWDDYFIGLCLLSAQRSKDPNTQVGAVIVSKERKVYGIGYNGFPIGCHDDSLPWEREGKTALQKKYLFVAHAELNAVINSVSRDLSGCTLYVGMFPCNECAKVVIQSGIRDVVYLSDKYWDTESCIATRMMFDLAGVSYRKYKPSAAGVRIDLRDGTSELDHGD